MASGDIPTDEQSRRLDSWKEIAEYLRRDVRTAMRWESQGLPLHRVAGGRGRSVFAFTHEIDAWMVGHAGEVEAGSAPIETPAEQPEQPAVEPSRHPFRTLTISLACALAMLAIVAAMMARRASAAVDLASLRVTATAAEVSIADASGKSRVIHRFDDGAAFLEGQSPRIEDLDADGTPEILALVPYYDNPDRSSRSGDLFNLSLAGDVRWRFAFDDVMTFADGRASGTWTLTDWQIEPAVSPKRIAVAAHEATWWASLVAVLDHNGRRMSTFMNSGWVESVLWLSSDRLAFGGFNNLRNEAVFAVLDAHDLAGRAPDTDGTEFACATCPARTPLAYVTFARSELNVLTAERFNRARITTSGDRILVTTAEIARPHGDATAIYEFTRDWQFIRAQYSDTYWGEHRRLELEGRVKHSRDSCPDREGPAAIHVWNAARGWVRTTPSVIK